MGAGGPGAGSVRPQAGGWSVRRATVGDFDAVVELVWAVAAEGRWLGAEVPFDRAARRQALEDRMDQPTGAVFVAVAEDRGDGAGPGIVGYLGSAVAPYGVADLAMAVAEGWRGRGVGRALLEAAIAWAPRAGAHKMALEVWPTNEPAIALYRKAGFVEEGRKRRHYRRRSGELWDSVLMGRSLP